ncbi:MAG: hypothetical protein K1X42_13695 [Opitutaceae bacterium]|nr:hypothetical protein [Opitutaceae bacterium]
MNRKEFLKVTASIAATPALVRAAVSESTEATGAAPNSYVRTSGPEIWSVPPPVRENPVNTPLPPSFTDGEGWTLALLPDTQIYSIEYQDVYPRQTAWLAANRERLNLCFVAHEGDIVHGNTHPEWLVAKNAHDILFKHGIPFSLSTGNHDLGNWGDASSRQTLLNDYVTERHYRNSARFGLYERQRLENSWHRFRTPGGEKLLVSLEFGPRKGVLEWANTIVSENASIDAIVVTHAYLYSDGTRYDWPKFGRAQKWNPHGYPLAAGGDVNDGQEIWDKFISRHANIRMVLSGHVLNNGTGHLASNGKDGRTVHQILANYQGGVKPDRGFGGGGFMRLVRFNERAKTAEIKTYSPWYDRWITAPEHDFTLNL